MYDTVTIDGVLYWNIDGRLVAMMAGGDDGGEDGTALDGVFDEDVEEPVEDEAKPDPKASQKGKGGAKQPAKSAAKQPGPAPWEKDLTDRGLDDPRFTEYMRTTVQPYITQLEQRGGGEDLFGGDQERAQVASNILNALESDPEATLTELAQRLGISLGGSMEVDAPEDNGEDYSPEFDGEEEQDDPRLAYIQQKMDEEQSQAAEARYNEILGRIESAHPGFDSKLFSLVVVNHGGDLRAAYADYITNWHKAPDPKNPPPPVLGGTKTGNPPVREAKSYRSIEDAVSDWFDEDAAASSR